MPSFDIVSEVDLQEARNAVDNASREVESRFDFRGVEATFELNDANKTIKVLSESDFQVNQLLDILRAKLLKRGIEGTSLDVPEDTDIYMPMVSRLAQLTVIDVLATGFTLRRGAKFRDNLKRVKEALKESRFDKQLLNLSDDR